ncbi:MAG TPA: sensor histidine kinase [Bryobacteraceae bacterium]|nr:sensor histidine kinase [Bryobacteraceae bacterium]
MFAASWLRYIAWVRAALAAIALGLSFVYPLSSPVVVRSLFGAFLLYTALVALRFKGMKGFSGLVALLLDVVFFLALATLGAEHLVWMASVFFLYLLTEALAFYTAIELVVIAGICAVCAAVLPSASIRMLEPTVLVAGTLACGFAVSQQRQKRAAEAADLRAAAAEKAVEKAREEERQRIASDFHDGPLQSFISLQMRLEILRKLMERDAHAGMEELKELQGLAQTQVRDLRTFLHSMRPVDVDGGNFVAVTRRMTESFQKESGIPVTFLGTNSPVGLPQETALEVLQMLRESLHNVQKHAGATRVALSLEKSDKGLEISIDDNGHGFPFAGSYTLEELELLRLGPASLKRRARALNAELTLESRPGRGASLKYRIPLQ